MRLLFKVCVVVALTAFVLTPVHAQQRPGGFGQGFQMGMGQLLQNPDVQKELKLSEDQVAKLKEATEKFREDHKDDLEKLRDRNLAREDRAELMKKVNEAQEKLASEILKPEQVKRVQQIQFQQRTRFGGLGVFASEEVQKALKLTDDQKEQIKTLGDDLRKDLEDLRGTAGGNMREAFTKMQQLNKEAGEKAQKLLTEEQKKAWKELVGEPFELQPGGFRPRPDGTERPNNPNRPNRPARPNPEQKKVDF